MPQFIPAEALFDTGRQLIEIDGTSMLVKTFGEGEPTLERAVV